MTRVHHDLGDGELIRACIDGDAAAWDELIDRFGRLVYSIPKRLGMPSHECDEVFQIVWAIVVQQLGQVREPARIGAWLAMTTRRECWRRLRSAPPAGDGSDAIESKIDSPEVSIARVEQDQSIRSSLARLDTPCRELLTALFEGTGRPSYDIIAERLGVPRGSIGPRRARCLDKLRGLIEGETSDSP